MAKGKEKREQKDAFPDRRIKQRSSNNTRAKTSGSKEGGHGITNIRTKKVREKGRMSFRAREPGVRLEVFPWSRRNPKKMKRNLKRPN